MDISKRIRRDMGFVKESAEPRRTQWRELAASSFLLAFRNYEVWFKGFFRSKVSKFWVFFLCCTSCIPPSGAKGTILNSSVLVDLADRVSGASLQYTFDRLYLESMKCRIMDLDDRANLVWGEVVRRIALRYFYPELTRLRGPRTVRWITKYGHCSWRAWKS
jgi:hypothetical protein